MPRWRVLRRLTWSCWPPVELIIFFGNGGTDFAPIIEAYAKRQVQELPAPRSHPGPP